MDKSKPKKKFTKNKGVNITSNELPLPEDYASEGTNTSGFPSLYNIRNQLQETIDVMGPATPHLIYTSSSADADNEDSLISSTSIFSSVLQLKQPAKTKDQTISAQEFESPRDISEILTSPESELLTVVHDFSRERPSQPLYLPAVLCMNPNCACTHAATFPQQIAAENNYEEQLCCDNLRTCEKKPKFSALIGKITKTHKRTTPGELYKMNLMQPRKDGSPPRRFVFDLIDEAPKPNVNTIGTNTKYYCPNKMAEQGKITRNRMGMNSEIATTHPSHYSGIVTENGKLQDTAYYENLESKSRLSYKSDQSVARVDVYYFDHGNAAYYKTTDCPPLIMTELVAERTEHYATKFWAELFGTVYIAFAFFTTFILQFFRFILHSIIRPLTIGVIQLVSDYFFKPFLAVIFNAIIQPPLIFFYNIATTLRDLCDPLAEGLGYYLREMSVLCSSIRLFEIVQPEKPNSEKNLRSKFECEQPPKRNKCGVT